MGRLEYHKIKVPYLDKEERTLRIYLPDSYDKSEKKYPVLYMHDGQNLFLDQDSYGGVSWKIKEIMDSYQGQDKGEFIIVGIDNYGNNRVKEYSPLGVYNAEHGISFRDDESLADKYLDFLVDDVKKYIDDNFRTKSGRKNNWMLGASSGAIITMYAAIKKKGEFSKFGVFSPNLWVYEGRFDKLWNEYNARNHEFYFYVGTEEGFGIEDHISVSRQYIDDTLRCLKLALNSGVRGKDIDIQVGYGSIHNEEAWMYAFPAFVDFLHR